MSWPNWTRRGQRCHCIRCREVRGQAVQVADLRLDDLVYHPAHAEEHFLSYVTPKTASPATCAFPCRHPAQIAARCRDLEGAALVREVHVYGQSLAVGAEEPAPPSISAWASSCSKKRPETARAAGFRQLAVIAAVGTRLYYESAASPRASCTWCEIFSEKISYRYHSLR